MTFRSLDMSHYTLIIPRDHAYRTVSQIALLEDAHFIDAGNHLDRQFGPQLKRCEELIQQLNLMKGSAKSAGFTYTAYNETEPGFAEKIYALWQQEAKQLGIEDVKLIDFYEAQINEEYARYE